VNFGVRYDTQNNFFNQSESANNRAYQVLKTIGSPFGQSTPAAPRNNFSPRVGFAWDMGGTGKDVIRAGYGLFFDQLNMVLGFQPNVISKQNLLVLASYTNSGVGAGQLAGKVYDPASTAWLPPAPPAINTAIPAGLNSQAGLFSPSIKNPYNQQAHVGYTHAFSQNTIVSVDYSHILGLNDWRQRQLNPFEGPWDANINSYNRPGCVTGSAAAPRRLSCALQTAFGDPLLFGSIVMYESTNRSQYNETIFHFEQRGLARHFKRHIRYRTHMRSAGLLQAPSVVQVYQAQSTLTPHMVRENGGLLIRTNVTGWSSLESSVFRSEFRPRPSFRPDRRDLIT